MKIIIFGSGGMLGRDLVEKFLTEGVEVIPKEKKSLDITNETAVSDFISEKKADIVINAAAYTHVDDCETKRDHAFRVNCEGTKNIARASSHTQAKMIYLSTDYMFDGSSKIPYTEKDIPQPINIYAKSKLAGENIVRELLDDFMIIRTSWLYGRHGKNFVETILDLGRAKDNLSVVNDQKGSPTFTKDLSLAISLLIKKDFRGVVHVANSGVCSWFEFSRKIFEFSGLDNKKITPVLTKEFPRPAKRPSYSVLNCEKYAKIVGNPLRHWEEALKEYLAI